MVSQFNILSLLCFFTIVVLSFIHFVGLYLHAEVCLRASLYLVLFSTVITSDLELYCVSFAFLSKDYALYHWKGLT